MWEGGEGGLCGGWVRGRWRRRVGGEGKWWVECCGAGGGGGGVVGGSRGVRGGWVGLVWGGSLARGGVWGGCDLWVGGGCCARGARYVAGRDERVCGVGGMGVGGVRGR